MHSAGPAPDPSVPPNPPEQKLHELRGERRIVTALFCDVVDSTAIAEQFDAEEWVEILDEAFRSIIGAIQRYEGTPVRLLGDAVVAYFGAPMSHEDDAERAILAGLAILNELALVKEEFRRGYGVEFNVRIGVNTGEAIFGSLGVNADEYTALGDAVNVAARLQQAAEPGTVLISDDTRRRVTNLFDVQHIGDLNVKGKRQPIPAFKVLRYRPPPRLLRGGVGATTPLVGRTATLDRLVGVLDDLSQGRGWIVCLVGDSGLGKSRLIEEVHRHWVEDHRHESTWIESRGISYDMTRPYGLFQQVLRQELGVAPGDSIYHAWEPTELRAVSRTDGSAQRVMRVADALLGSVMDREPLQLTGEDFQRELFDAVLTFYRDRATQAPLILVFDDLHWADSSSVDLLVHLLTLAESLPVLILCAMRPERQSMAWHLKQVIETDYPHRSLMLQLDPLSDSESRDLISRLLDATSIPETTLRSIHQKTEGNPLFIEEIVRALNSTRKGGEARDLPEISVPETLQALLISRMDKLTPETKRVLQRAAVIGREFSLRILERVLEAASPLDQHLNTLERAGFLEELQRIPERRYSFRHDLMRETAYRSILRRERRNLHRQVGEAMEGLYADRRDDESYQLAHHFAEADDLERGLTYAVMAGERASRLFANTEAISHYSKALELARKADAPHGEIGRLLAERGRLLALTGDFPRAHEDWETARSLARLDSDKDAEWQALIGMGDLWTGRDYDRAGDYFEEALRIAREIDDPHPLARSLLQIGNWQVNVERADEARGNLESALEIFEQLGDRRGIAETEDLLGIVADIRSDLPGWKHHSERAVELYREVGDLKGLASTLAVLSSLTALNSFDTFAFPKDCVLENAEELNHEALDVSREIGWRSGESFALMSKALLTYGRGDVGSALEAADQAAEIAEMIGHREWQAGSYATLGIIYRDILASERSVEHLQRALAHARDSASIHWCNINTGFLASAYVSIGDLVRAEHLLGTSDAEMPMSTLGQRQVWLARAELAHARGDSAGSLEILDRMILTALNHVDDSDTPGLSRRRGEVLAALGRHVEAVAVLQAALSGAFERWMQSGLWRYYLVLGHALQQADRNDEAQVELHHAWDSVQEIAATIPDESLRSNFREQAKALIFPESRRR